MSIKVTQLINGGSSACGDASKIQSTPIFDDSKSYKCLFCCLNIETKPIGCPITCIERLESSPSTKHLERVFSFEFQTFGVFCSYNCAKAYALDHVHNPIFRKSIRYLAMMYSYDKYGKIDKQVTIEPSPSPLLLAYFGGFMTENQYKAELGKISYISNGNTCTFPLTFLFQRKV